MGGTTICWKGKTLLEAISSFLQNVHYTDQMGVTPKNADFMEMNSISVMFRNEKGEWMVIGEEGYQVEVPKLYMREEDLEGQNFMISAHFHT